MVTVKMDPMDGASPDEKNYAANIPASGRPHSTGIAGANYPEAIPSYEKADCERVYKGKNDSYIVLGRDRTGTLLEGYGMKGEPKCSSIDIVVGRWSGLAPKVNEKGKENKVHPNFIPSLPIIRIPSAFSATAERSLCMPTFPLAKLKAESTSVR